MFYDSTMLLIKLGKNKELITAIQN